MNVLRTPDERFEPCRDIRSPRIIAKSPGNERGRKTAGGTAADWLHRSGRITALHWWSSPPTRCRKLIRRKRPIQCRPGSGRSSSATAVPEAG
jgi:hypothetical protein